MGGPTRKVGGAETPQYAVIAQLVEQPAFTRSAAGSNPAGGTKADDPLKYPTWTRREFAAGIPARLSLMRTMRGFFIGL